METINELTEYVAAKAKEYVEETGGSIAKFPASIVDFVIEYTANGCHFPKDYTEKQIVAILEKGKNSLAMACNDVYSKAGAEGQISHSENGVSRAYDSSWISFNLLANFPNFVTVL